MATKATKTAGSGAKPEAPPEGQTRTIPLVALRETVIFPEMIVPLQVGRDKSVQALVRSVQAQIEQYVQSGAPVPPEAAVAARNITEPGLLADMVAYSPDMSTEQRQELLETIDVIERLKLVSNFLAHQVEVLELKGRIQSEVKSEMDKTQREYILR